MLEGPIEPLEPTQPSHGYNSMYIKIMHHPHSGVSEPTIIPIEGDIEASDSASKPIFVPQSVSKPWAPFQTRADFKYTESVVQSRLNTAGIDAQLYGIHHGWCQQSNITLWSNADMQKFLNATWSCVVKVLAVNVSTKFCTHNCCLVLQKRSFSIFSGKSIHI